MQERKLHYSGETYVYPKGNWYNPKIVKHSRCWKDQRKSRHQYKPVQMS